MQKKMSTFSAKNRLFIISCIMLLLFTIPLIVQTYSYNNEMPEDTNSVGDTVGLDFDLEGEIEDTNVFIQPIPSHYRWLIPTDKKTLETWKQESKNFILPIDLSMCYLPTRGMFRSHRVATSIPHTGIDLYAYDSTDVLAAMAGKILYMGYIGAKGRGKAFGWTIIIAHRDNQGNFNEYYSIYAHITKQSICVSKGDEVTQGQIIAKVGTSGNANGYPTQVHFEIRKTKDPLFAQVKLSSPSCKNKVQLFDPEVILKREQYYAFIRNVDTKANLELLKSKLPDDFNTDTTFLQYITQVRQRLSATSYPVNTLQLLVASHVRPDGTVSEGTGNHFTAQTICDQTKTCNYFQFTTPIKDKSCSNYYKNAVKAINASRFKKHLKVEFSFNDKEGIRLYYAQSGGKISCLSYQSGRIVDKIGVEHTVPDIVSFQDVAVLEFGNTEGFWKLDDQKYTRSVIQAQNLISYWSKGKNVVMFAGNCGMVESNQDSSTAETSFRVPGLFINKLVEFSEKHGTDTNKILAASIAENKQVIQNLKETFNAKFQAIIDGFDKQLNGTEFSFYHLDSLKARLDSFLSAGVITQKEAGKRIDVINKYGLSNTYKINDQIWDAVQNKQYDSAMNTFTRNSIFLYDYSEEQYNQIFNRLENIEPTKQKIRIDSSFPSVAKTAADSIFQSTLFSQQNLDISKENFTEDSSFQYEMFIQKGNNAFKIGDYDQAIKLYIEAKKIFPDRPDAQTAIHYAENERRYIGKDSSYVNK